GRLYPAGTKDGDRLSVYAQHFEAVEVDSTYYAAPNPYVVKGWARKTPEEFRFALKMPRDLFDPKKELSAEAIGAFVETAQLLGEKLGPIVLQFAPWFRAPPSLDHGNALFLQRLLALLPPGPEYVVELREKGWFQSAAQQWLSRELGERSIPLCWSSLTYVDVPPLRTGEFAYLRFIGDHETVPAEVHGEVRVDRTKEMKQWTETLRTSGLSDAWAFFNNHFEGYGPASAERFQALLGPPDPG
ncbi:MAG: DUF72 domain-containing protein, partial [Thermoplasmata archaeon]|nr:DUF72 domain-containing protein [Thermoplasmata archaeon]